MESRSQSAIRRFKTAGFCSPLLLAAALIFIATPIHAADSIAFRAEIEPILHTRCYGCHGPSQQMNGLRLDRKDAALKGGYSGPVIVPGNAGESALIKRLESTKDGFRMPPVDPRLTAREVAKLREWIDQGAPWPDEAVPAARASADTEDHWAFQPIERPEPPEVRRQDWVRNPIDAFVLAKLESEGITPSRDADRVTLLRRVSFDLTGLPPTPQQLREFLDDKSENAYERLVDRLLKSPHYGEKWARHWLDLARYADSDGYEKDLVRPHAWRWRHWVIEALNEDMPFDQFTIEQIAGDLLPESQADTRVATGFHRNALKNREAGVKREEARFEEVVDHTNTVGTVWLGLTVGCAQCHDHKYDAISQREYYQLFAFFNSAGEETVPAPLDGELDPYLEVLPDYRARRDALLEAQGVAELQRAWEEKIRYAMDHPGESTDWDFWVTALRASLDNGERMLRKPAGQRTQVEKDRVTDYFLSNPGPDIAKDLSTRDCLRALDEDLERLAGRLPEVSHAYVLEESAQAVTTHLAVRGDYRRPGIEVEPTTLGVLPPFPQGEKPPRLLFAQWLVSPENPLTPRVAVNRMWQEFFATGLVRTSDDFGTQGERPTHPELLDWLANEFVAQGWSMKRMHRRIVMSSTYRQSSHTRKDLEVRDPGNRLLARQARVRLSAEQIRDAALAASGLLHQAVGGKSIRPLQPEGISKLTYGTNAWNTSDGKDRYRRGLYILYRRTSPYPQLANFDAPNTNTAATRRDRSNTPLQALNLLNDPVFFEAAQALALRVLESAGPAWNDRLEHAFQLCVARKPDAVEKDHLRTYFERQRQVFEKNSNLARRAAPFSVPGVEQAEAAAWAGLSRALMNLDEFITRE